jgi:hypothetical protein
MHSVAFFVPFPMAIPHANSLYLHHITTIYAKQKNPQGQGISKPLCL